MRDESGWIHLSTAEFSLLLSSNESSQEYGEPVAVLGIEHIARTRQRHAELVETASGLLRARGLGTIERPADDLAGLLRTLGRSRRSIELIMASDITADSTTQLSTTQLRGVAAADERAGVLVLVAGERVRMGPVRPTALVGSLLGVLPPLPAGPGRTANVRHVDYLYACARGEAVGRSAFTAALREAGLHAAEAFSMERAVVERRAGGQLASTSTGRDGRRRRGDDVLSFVDTPGGRYAMVLRRGWLTVTPADVAKLSSMAAELFAS